MEIFPALLAICVGNSPVSGEFPAQTPVTRSFVISLICPWIKGWVSNRETGDLRRHRAHYDVIVMTLQFSYETLPFGAAFQAFRYKNSVETTSQQHGSTSFVLLQLHYIYEYNMEKETILYE